MVLCRPRREQIYRRSLVERIPVDRTFHDPPLKIRVCFSLPTHTAGHVPHVSTFRIGSLHICLYFFDFPLTVIFSVVFYYFVLDLCKSTFLSVIVFDFRVSDKFGLFRWRLHRS